MDEKEIVERKKLRRAKAPRSRTGCRTCRLRHVKCDESFSQTKLSCRNCQVGGRVCDGPPKLEPLPGTSVTASSPVLGSSLNASAVLPEAGGERRYFHFFLQCTAPELSGYFDSDFYKRYILQMSRDQPAIRHALIALGSLHEGIKLGEQVGGPLRNNSLQHYNRAIGALSKNSAGGHQTISVMLICCLLFIWCETIQGNHGLRMQQLKSGLNILEEWQRNIANNPTSVADPEVQFIKEQLVPIFTRFDLQGVTFESGRQPQLKLYLRLENDQSGGIPAAFTSVEEARDWLDVIIYWLTRAVHREQPSGPFPTPLNGHLYLDQWGLALDEYFRTQQSTITDARIRAATILRIYQKMTAIMLASRISFNEADYEPFSPQFKVITALAESLLHSSQDGTLDGFRFSFEMGVIAPLFYVSSKCQNQVIRTRALSLLLQCPQKGGIWQGLGAAKMASLGAVDKVKEIAVGGENSWAGRYEMAAENSSSSPAMSRTSNQSTSYNSPTP